MKAKFKAGDKVKGTFKFKDNDGDRYFYYSEDFVGIVQAYDSATDSWLVNSNQGLLHKEIETMELAEVFDSPLYKVMNETEI
jgi:hypothetical protein